MKVTRSSQISVFPSVIVKLTVSYVATLVRHIICVIHWEKRDLLWTWSHLRVYRVQLHRYMRGVVRMVTKCCYREVILALSRENLVSVLVCRCNLCILSKAPTSCVVLYRNTLKALHVQFKQMSSSPVSLFRDSTKYPVIHLCNFVSVVFN